MSQPGHQLSTGYIGTYHVEAQAPLALCLEHDHIHDAHYLQSAAFAMPDPESIPVNIFLYHVRASSSDTSGGPRDLSTNSPSESITRYVGIAGKSEALRNDISVVNLLLTAPGKSTLFRSMLVRFPQNIHKGLSPIRTRSL